MKPLRPELRKIDTAVLTRPAHLLAVRVLLADIHAPDLTQHALHVPLIDGNRATPTQPFLHRNTSRHPKYVSSAIPPVITIFPRGEAAPKPVAFTICT